MRSTPIHDAGTIAEFVADVKYRESDKIALRDHVGAIIAADPERSTCGRLPLNFAARGAGFAVSWQSSPLVIPC